MLVYMYIGMISIYMYIYIYIHHVICGFRSARPDPTREAKDFIRYIGGFQQKSAILSGALYENIWIPEFIERCIKV